MGAAEAKAAILANKTALGIEFGSTRIKAVLVDDKNQPIASGAHEWENRYENGVWTYSLDDIWTGIQDCYQDMAKDVKAKYDIELESVGAFGVSAMMHEGSGDSTVAGIASALYHQEDDQALLTKANVLGMLNAQEATTGHINIHRYDGLYQQINVKEV